LAAEDPQSVSILRAELAAIAGSAKTPTYIYTYPPRVAYRELTDSTVALAGWQRLSGQAGIYIHVPFCEWRCRFCNLFSATAYSSDLVEAYVRTVAGELDIVASAVDANQIRVSSVYFGGGTPTVLAPSHLDAILQLIGNRFALQSIAEISIETTPNALTDAVLSDILGIGFNRISIGVQSLNDRELAEMGRPYEAALAESAVGRALWRGAANVNVDLIYGLPYQTEASWMESLTMTRYTPLPLGSVHRRQQGEPSADLSPRGRSVGLYPVLV